ncbi:MAG TPA: GAF domain-containing sensor histidine kinase [Ktedonobacteraceae bacterium]|nr:GAF domain-containing sensor histidine kinase [Ktedonobacteraceae bacterium]
MSQKNRFLKTTLQPTLRQWRHSPTYFFLIWRWGNWVFALIWYLTLPSYAYSNVPPILRVCLLLALLQSLVVTLYSPLSRLLLAQRRGRSTRRKEKHLVQGTLQVLDEDDETARILNPLTNSRNAYWSASIYVFDILICGLLTYFSAVNENPSFGVGSPFYRYGLSAVMVAGFNYSYSGGLLAALIYSAFAILGVFVLPPGQLAPVDKQALAFNIAGSVIDAPLIALLSAYLASQLNKAIQGKRQVQELARRETALRGVSEILVTGSSDQVQLLRRSVKAIRQGGHFEKLVIALVIHDPNGVSRPDFDTYVEADVAASEYPDVSEELVSLVAKTGQRHMSFDPLIASRKGSQYGLARLYQPFFKEGLSYLVIGAESTRNTPFELRQAEFLTTIGGQLMIALENIRLTAETATLATLTERGRIAREIHDGIAQLLYMLSLNSETCLALVERTVDAAEPGNDSLAPVKEFLEKQVTISKQALWETRHYMFTLQPLITGNTTLTQMLTNQLQEFEAISGLPTHLEIEGQEEALNGDQRRNQRRLQVGTALFRITQEALTNAYKHAEASQLEVLLRHQSERITIEISDNGCGISLSGNTPGSEKIYTGRGLPGMRERAAELDGTLEIRSNATGGTRVVVSIPV